jgi:branched-subunit amino acid aminotransferase/4-amino-4-deoxychorismate lyase
MNKTNSTNYFFLRNGQILTNQEPMIDIQDIAYTYGFAVYETMKIRKKHLYFIDKHLERLFYSAKIIGLNHSFEAEDLKSWLYQIAQKLEFRDANLKILLFGGTDPQLWILPLNPLYVDRKAYKKGAKVITFNYQRWRPQAKTLNMLPSYVYFTQAKNLGLYDCIFVDHTGHFCEGSRTNLMAISQKTIFCPPLARILDGVTRQTILQVAKANGFKFEEVNFDQQNLQSFESVFLTSTSTKILPINQIYLNNQDFVDSLDNLKTIDLPKPSDQLKKLVKHYDQFLDQVATQTSLTPKTLF